MYIRPDGYIAWSESLQDLKTILLDLLLMYVSLDYFCSSNVDSWH